ncbi:MAG: hypothetical protein AB1798_02155 [Spirochaetota bacterium]
MVDWKIIIGMTVGAVVLSLLAGIIGGVSFGIILLRAIVGGLAFGLFGLGAGYIIRKFLPELFKTLPDEETTDGSESGIEIILPDENPHEKINTEEAAQEFAPGGQAIFSEDELSDSEELIEEVEERSSIIESRIDKEAEEAEEMEPLDSDSALAFSDKIDNLPEITAFESSFSSTGEVDSLKSSGKSAPANDAIDVLGNQMDPKVVARAIQTIMKKD